MLLVRYIFLYFSFVIFSAQATEIFTEVDYVNYQFNSSCETFDNHDSAMSPCSQDQSNISLQVGMQIEPFLFVTLQVEKIGDFDFDIVANSWTGSQKVLQGYYAKKQTSLALLFKWPTDTTLYLQGRLGLGWQDSKYRAAGTYSIDNSVSPFEESTSLSTTKSLFGFGIGYRMGAWSLTVEQRVTDGEDGEIDDQLDLASNLDFAVKSTSVGLSYQF